MAFPITLIGSNNQEIEYSFKRTTNTSLCSEVKHLFQLQIPAAYVFLSRKPEVQPEVMTLEKEKQFMMNLEPKCTVYVGVATFDVGKKTLTFEHLCK